MMRYFKKILPYLLFLLFLSDLAYSFYIHYNTPLAGDLAEITYPLPNKGSDIVLKHPFGFAEGKYQNPNRFFAYWTTGNYFKIVPKALQQFVSPVKSLYLSSAIAKTLIQLGLIILLSSLISNSKKLISFDFTLAIILITPLFQSFGYNRYMGIIDQSIVYTIFYAFPLFLVVLLFSSFLRKMIHGVELKINLNWYIFTFILIIFLGLNGPIIPAILLLISSLICLVNFWQVYTKKDKSNIFRQFIISLQKIDRGLLFIIILSTIIGLYSLYLSTFDSLSEGHLVPLIERYKRLPNGLLKMISGKLGYILLLLVVIINFFLIKKIPSTLSKKISQLYVWLILFSVIYLILLPLGGYRVYRANIIRYDTAMPITLSLIFLFGLSSLHLIKNLPKKLQVYYSLGIGVILIIFTNADKIKENKSLCEKELLTTLSNSTKKYEALNCDCTLMEWNTFNNYKQSEINANFFYQLGITSQKILYKQDCE